MAILEISPSDLRLGMQASRNKYGGQAPDYQWLKLTAGMVREEVQHGILYDPAVERVLEEAGIDKSVRKLFRTALFVAVGRKMRSEFPIRREPEPPTPKREPCNDPFSWRVPVHQVAREAKRMAYQRRDHLIPDDDR